MFRLEQNCYILCMLNSHFFLLLSTSDAIVCSRIKSQYQTNVDLNTKVRLQIRVLGLDSITIFDYNKHEMKCHFGWQQWRN